MIMSVVTKPELYFQPEMKQKGEETRLPYKSLEVSTAGCHS